MKRLLMLGGTALLAVSAFMAMPAHADECPSADRECDRQICPPDRFGYVAPVYPSYRDDHRRDHRNDRDGHDRNDRNDFHRDGWAHNRR